MITLLKNFLFPSQFTLTFDPNSNIIQVPVLLENQEQELFTTFALDTGATYSVVDESVAHFLNLETTGEKIDLSTVSGNQVAHISAVEELSVGPLTQYKSPVIITDLPDDSGISGLLGISFLKHYKVSLNFKKGVISLK